MKNKYGLFLFLLCFQAFSQVGINTMTPHSSSMLEISSTEKGILIPRMTSAERIAIASPATGLMVYDTTLNAFSYYDGTTWNSIGGSGTNYWTLSGTNLYNNSGTNLGIGLTAPSANLDITGTNAGSNSLQLRSGNLSGSTSSNQILFGYNNSASFRHAIKTRHQSGASQGNAIDFYAWNYGVDATGTVGTKHLMTLDGTGYVGLGTTTPNDKLHVVGNTRIDNGRIEFYNTGGSVFIGNDAGLNDSKVNSFNNFVGYFSGKANTSGTNNTAYGAGAMETNTTGSFNTYIGRLTGLNNTTGSNNTFLGSYAGYNSTGSSNIYVGRFAGFGQTTDNKLFIDNTNTSTPLIYGEFDTDLLRVNGTLNINNAYSLPTTSGTANYVLQSNGAGATSWVNPNTLSLTENDPQVSSTSTNMIPKWNGSTLTDGLMLDNGTNVGVGVANPAAKLDVSGTNSGSTSLQLRSGNSGNATSSNQIVFGYNNTSDFKHAIKSRHQSGGAQGNAIDFYTWKYGTDADGAVGTQQVMTLDGTGYVGIGITTPLDKLHINGNARIDGGKIDFRNTGFSTFVGESAGSNDDNTNNQNTAVGAYSQFSTTSGYRNVSNGANTLYSNTTGYNNVAVGFNASLSNSTGYGNVAIGEGALYFNQTGNENVAIGKLSGIGNLGSGNVFIGNSAGANELGSNKLYIDNNNTLSPLIYGEFDTDLVRVNGTLNINNAYSLPTTSGTANYVLQTNGSGATSWVNPNTLSVAESDPQVSSATSNMIPKWNGSTLTDGLMLDNGTNVGVGVTNPSAKLDVSGTNSGSTSLQLRSGNSGNSTSSNQIIFGYNNTSDFKHAIKSRHQSAGPQGNAIDFYTWKYGTDTDGSVGTQHVMTLDGTGYVGIGITTPLEKLHVKGSTRIDGGKIDFRNTGLSTFIGEYAGQNDDFTTNENSGFGGFSLYNNTSGYRNVANGAYTLYSNTTGYNNVAIGFNASLSNSTGYGNVAIGEGSLYSNQTGNENVAIGKLSGIGNLGSGNVFIGNSAGASELGSNKLYIDNNNTGSPLIYGEFDTDVLRVNGTLNINNAYSLPTTSGTANYILQTNGAGAASWVNPNSLTVTESDPQVSSATSNMIPKWNGSTLTDGIVYDNGTNIGIGTTSPGSKLEVQNAAAVNINVKSTTNTAAINVTSPNANDATFYINTLSGANSLRRWGLGKANNNESGSNAGSFFVLNRYDDSGTYLGQPILINRTTGGMTIGNDNVSTTDNTLKVNGSMSLKVMTVVSSNNTTTLDGDDYSVIFGGTITGNSVVLPAANSCTGRVYLIINHSSSSVTISSYITANGTNSTAVANGSNVQIMSDGTNWHRIN